ncbi:hypothetical protein D1007_17773 [Hordeum vulgare]|nr:hypothetical protein D1007_17773 [Hordeum vulgare]
MEGSRPRVLWLWADDCYNGPVWSAVNLTPGSAMFLMRGWKSFARSRGVGLGHLLHFKFDDSATLSLKFLTATSIRLECCAERSSGSNIDTSTNSDNDNNVFRVKLEADVSE